MAKPNCYKCKYRGRVAGSAHSSCKHPSVGKTDPMDKMIAILASVGRAPAPSSDAAKELNITASAHGINSGWFSWPFNFDPMWLNTCDGFISKEE